MSLSFKCPTCKGTADGYKYGTTGYLRPMGNTLLLQEDGTFQCRCGHKEPALFWKRMFEDKPDELSLTEAADVIGVSRATLRRAAIDRRICTFKKKDQLTATRYVTLKNLEHYYVHILHHRTKGKNINGDFFEWLKDKHPEITLEEKYSKVIHTYFKKPSRGIAILNRPTFDNAEKNFITQLLAEYGVKGRNRKNGKGGNHK